MSHITGPPSAYIPVVVLILLSSPNVIGRFAPP
jgi:hypothetical protein